MNSPQALAFVLFSAVVIAIFGTMFMRSPLFSNREYLNRGWHLYLAVQWIKAGRAHGALAFGMLCFSAIVALITCAGYEMYVGVTVFFMLIIACNAAMNLALEARKGTKIDHYWEAQLRRPAALWLANPVNPGEQCSMQLAGDGLNRLWQLACLRSDLLALVEDGTKKPLPIVKVGDGFFDIDPLGFTVSEIKAKAERLSGTLKKKICNVDEHGERVRISYELRKLPFSLKLKDMPATSGVMFGMSSRGAVIMPPEQWPHMFVAGTTGAGKSTFLIAVCYQLIKHYPASAIIVNDIKLEDFAAFEAWPNFVRGRNSKHFTNIAAAIEKEREKREAFAIARTPVFFIVDEFSAVMDKNNRKGIERIAELGRSSRIHLVMATRRPTISDTMLTGVIRECLDTRVCFRVLNDHDSTVMLRGDNSAASLRRIPGRGLVLDKAGRKIEFQTPFVDNADIAALINSTPCTSNAFAAHLREIMDDDQA